MYPLRIAVISLLVAAIAAGCGRIDGNEAVALSGTPVMTALVHAGSVEEIERSIARSEAMSMPVISAEANGRVERVLADIGDIVEIDAVLAELDDGAYRLALAAADADVAALKAQVSQLGNDLERIRRIGDGQYVSAAELEGMETRLESARQQLVAAENRRDESQRQLERTRIRAPIAGRIDARMISEGDYVSAGDPAFRAVPSTGARVRLPFPEIVGDRVEPGMPVRLRRLGRADEDVFGRISRIRPTVSGGMSVIAVVEFEAPPQWQAGTMIEGRVVVERREGAVLVPASSVVDRPGRKVVYILPGDTRHGEVEERAVRIGQRNGGTTEVLSGVTAGERIVVDGAAYLSDGAPVRELNGT